MINSHKNPTDDLREFGRRLTTYREAAGISRKKLANTVGVSQQHVWRVENGFRGCSRDLTIIISSRLNLNIEQINELLLLTGHRPVAKRGDTQRTSRLSNYDKDVLDE
jgi:transcriptional regulator with XRE-family HTH domain